MRKVRIIMFPDTRKFGYNFACCIETFNSLHPICNMILHYNHKLCLQRVFFLISYPDNKSCKASFFSLKLLHSYIKAHDDTSVGKKKTSQQTNWDIMTSM